MGLKVFPLIPISKAPATPNGVLDATRDEARITKWWTEKPDAGIGLAPELKVGGACFLEFDKKPSLKDWAKEQRKAMPATRVHKSGGKGGPHYIFLNTELSVAMGDVNGSKDHEEWFSFRTGNRYVVAPPSISPDTHQPYETWLDIEPQPIPDWVVYKIGEHGVSEHQFAEGMRGVDEDFDFDSFTDWLAECGCDLGTQDGSWIPFKQCPFVGRRHKGQGVRGCALYYDGSVLGFKCMAAECPSNMDRKPGQGGAGFLVSFLSKEHAAYDGVVWGEREDQMGAVSAEEAETLIATISDEPEQDRISDLPVIVCTTKGCGNWQPGATTLCEHCKANSGRKCEECSGALSPLQTTTICQNCLNKAMQPEPITVPEAWGAATAVAPAKAPTFDLAEAFPKECMYGWLGKFAHQLQCPLSLAYPALLCVFAGQGISKSGSVRGNLFGCLIGPKGTGKTRTIERCLSKLEYEFPWTIKRRYPGSEHGLMLILEGKKPKDLTALDNISKPFLLVQDEMRSTFGKMGIDNSALPFAFNHLFYLDEYGTENQKGGMICFAKLSMIGGLTAENPEEFAEVFGKTTVTGLYDRHIYGVAPKTWKWDDRWEETVAPVKRRPKNVNIGQEIFHMKRDWVGDNPDRNRLGELALRVAVVTASANEDHKVTIEGMRCALLLMEWQEKVRVWYKPSDQDDKDGKCQEAIVRVLERMGSETAGGWVKWSGKDGAKQRGNLARHTAARVNRMFKAMLEFGMIEEERDTDDGGNETKKKSGRVRLKQG